MSDNRRSELTCTRASDLPGCGSVKEEKIRRRAEERMDMSVGSLSGVDSESEQGEGGGKGEKTNRNPFVPLYMRKMCPGMHWKAFPALH